MVSPDLEGKTTVLTIYISLNTSLNSSTSLEHNPDPVPPPKDESILIPTKKSVFSISFLKA